MKPKKSKGGPGRAVAVRRRKALNDIPPSTSLPPLVEGQLRCFLKLTVSKIVWMVAKPPASSLVRVRWWGETTNGTTFVPQDVSQPEQKILNTTTCYPVRCGPKQFASYLTDMGSLILEVMTRSDHLPIGRVEIQGLALLSPSHPISGFFTIVSPSSEKMGELQISLFLEPLSDVYGSNHTVHNTNANKDVADLSRSLPPSQLHRPAGTHVHGKESRGSSRASTPRGKDHLYFQENSENIQSSLAGSHPHLDYILSTKDPKPPKMFSNNSEAQMKSGKESTRPVRVLCNSPTTKDLLADLLDRGNRLRNAMAVSVMISNPDPVIEQYEGQPAVKQDLSRQTSKTLKNLGLMHEDSLEPLRECSEFDLDAEKKAVELLLGSSDLSPDHLVDGAGSPPESLSPSSHLYDSELNDPHYDQSLLENLFYAAQKSDSSLSDVFSDEEEAGKPSQPQGPKSQRSPKALELSPHRLEKKALEARASCSPAKPLPCETFPESSDEIQAVNLSLDRLATLGRIRLARVVIETLRGVRPEDNTQSTPNPKSPAGKPPRPALAKKRTFFVEYHFPVRTSKNGVGQTAVTTEIVRVASSRLSADGVKFQQRYVFPVHFSGSMITHWWKSPLDFNVFLKKGAQRKPVLIGTAAFPLRDVLRSEDLFVSHELPVEEDGIPGPLGPLQVSVELVAANKDASNIKASSASPRAPTGSIRAQGPILQGAERSPASTRSPPSACKAPGRSNDPLPPSFPRSPKAVVQPPGPLPVSRNLLTQMSASDEDGMLLHVLLMVSEGQVAHPPNGGLDSTCNLYLNCKLFSTEEATRSPVAWGSPRPTFHFSQITPVALTSKHLERLRNNVMVIEVWNKVLSPGGDRLLGLAKLPLHQFYVSFKDPKVSKLLLQAQYPVLAVDGPVPVVDVFSGQKNGSLTAILAMGSADQVLALQRVKKEEGLASPAALRPPHALDPLPVPGPELSSREKEGLVEHTFEIHIEGVQGLMPLQSTVWGEADCYVQYHFPVQKPESDTLRDAESTEKGLELKAYRTSTALCVPDPTFRDEHHHSLLLPAGVPVQRLLLRAFSAQSLVAEGGGVHFEIWCRYYYPNVRDQMVARASLPLSRLCAMVTMQHRQEVGIQTFHLPVMPRIGGSGELCPRSSGLFQVSVKYRRSLKITENILAARETVPISIQIHAAAGLQAAARALAEKHPSFQYSAEIGLNTYVSIHLPFLPGTERRQTRTVARSFCPAFEHHVELPCHLVVQGSSGGACCLGELLQRSEGVFRLYHQPLNSAPGETLKDCLLGTIRVPTRDLLIRRSGLRGWYPIILPEDLLAWRCADVMQSVVGGLEISVAFVRPGDRERVLESASRLGWNWKEDYSEDAWEDSESEGQAPTTPVRVTISTPQLWLPLQSMLLAGETRLNKSVYCYLRYKLYDREATWTSLRRPKFTEGEKHGTVMFKKPNQMELQSGPALFWYFREEKLELQVWRAYGKDGDVERPLDTDRLIGSAYVDLAPLADSSRRKKTVSGVFPLFRRNAANLGGAALRVHIAVTPAGPCGGSRNDDRDSSSSSAEEEKKAAGQELEVRSEANPSVGEAPENKPPAGDPENTFAVSILVERAMHLSLKGSPLAERGVTSPCSYVSFVATDVDNPITTATVENTDSPVWDFQQQTRLSKELLLDSQRTLVFKIWHKADVERVIGFASVDLSPLLSGFQHICGWYDITDLSGQCRGQVKVAVSPLESIAHLKEERKARSCQARDPYSSFPSFSTRGAPQFSGSPWKSPEASSHARAGSRYEEHVQNVRRFHTSLQQAEEKTDQAENLDSLFLSPHTSLFRALRKNLNELDEIQRYFSEKLTRPLTDLSTPSSTTEGLDTQRPFSRRIDPEEDQPQKEPLHRVPQFSSQRVDQWTKRTSHPEEPSKAHEDGLRFSSSDQALLGQENRAPRTEMLKAPPSSHEFWNARVGEEELFFAIGKSPSAENGLYEFSDPANSPKAPPPGFLPGIQREEDSAQSHSEEEYEEAVIEPRTLNEITTVTDKTSPWSSFFSEAEQEPVHEAQRTKDGDRLPTESAIGDSTTSDMIQEDPLSGSSIAGSGNSPFRGEDDEEHAEREPRLEAGEEEEASTAGRVEPADILKVDQERLTEIQDGGPEEVSSTHHGGGDFARPRRVVPEAREGRENLPRDTQREEGVNVNGEEGLQLCPPSQETMQETEAYSGEDDEDLPEEFSASMVTLSEPIVVPNFFLPPQHLEVSMRLLSASSSPLAVAHKAAEDRSDAPGIPPQRTIHPSPSPMPLQPPEEEMKRIARIFSTQFSKKA